MPGLALTKTSAAREIIMEIATQKISDAKHFQRVLNTPRPVFILFISDHCPACVSAGPLFERIASRHPWIVSIVLNCVKTPRHPSVMGTPTLLIYLNGTLMEVFKGFGPEQEQVRFVTDTFKRYDQRKVAKPPALPAAPPPPPPSSASLHAPGYRPPPANGPAGSSPGRPTSDSPRSQQP